MCRQLKRKISHYLWHVGKDSLTSTYYPNPDSRCERCLWHGPDPMTSFIYKVKTLFLLSLDFWTNHRKVGLAAHSSIETQQWPLVKIHESFPGKCFAPKCSGFLPDPFQTFIRCEDAFDLGLWCRGSSPSDWRTACSELWAMFLDIDPLCSSRWWGPCISSPRLHRKINPAIIHRPQAASGK